MTPTPVAGADWTDAQVAAELVRTGLATAFGQWAEALTGPVREKNNLTDVVTAADEAAEAAMLAVLETHRPEDGVLGEEGTSRPGTSGRTWVLDPLDGTYNFTRAGERWCCAAALVDGSTPLLGAVAGGGAARVWVGGPGSVATEDGAALAPLVDHALARANLLTYLHPPHHDTAVGRAWRRVAGAAATLRMTGSSSLDATDVAAGRAELLVQHSLPAWDRLPGDALIASVGGVSSTVHAAGVDWHLAGVPTAVAEAAALLRD